jgi:hypothetical protein
MTRGTMLGRFHFEVTVSCDCLAHHKAIDYMGFLRFVVPTDIPNTKAANEQQAIQGSPCMVAKRRSILDW